MTCCPLLRHYPLELFKLSMKQFIWTFKFRLYSYTGLFASQREFAVKSIWSKSYQHQLQVGGQCGAEEQGNKLWKSWIRVTPFEINNAMESVRIYLISLVSISTSVYDRYSKILVARFKETSEYGIRNHSPALSISIFPRSYKHNIVK